MRPVSVKVYHSGNDVRYEEGIFHQFATESEERNDGILAIPVGIVELKDGTVITAYAPYIRFLDVGKV